jgi:ribosomal protein S18 acetylase RimI-like enzyme
MKTFYEIKTSNDIALLCSLASKIWHEYWKILLSDEQIAYMLAKFQSPEAVKEQIKHENYIYKLIKDDEEIIGYFGVCEKQQYLFLSKLYIVKEHRGKGIGKLAFKEIQKIARNKGLKSIRLTVNKYNTNSIKAYEKWGFDIVDSCVVDIGKNFVMDDYIMEFKSI